MQSYNLIITTICILFVNFSLTQVTEGCYSESFNTLPCGIEYRSSIPILNGLASISSPQSLVSVGTSMYYSPCDWDLGTCSTSMISSLESGLACTGENCAMVIDFTIPIVDLEITSLLQNSFADSEIEITAFSGDEMVFSHKINRDGEECTSASSFSIKDSTFDLLIIRGNNVVVSGVSVCTVQTPKFVQYQSGETLVEVSSGQCTFCTDIHGVDHWNRISCNSGECASIRYSNSDCTGMGILTLLPTLNAALASECFIAKLPAQSM